MRLFHLQLSPGRIAAAVIAGAIVTLALPGCADQPVGPVYSYNCPVPSDACYPYYPYYPYDYYAPYGYWPGPVVFGAVDFRFARHGDFHHFGPPHVGGPGRPFGGGGGGMVMRGGGHTGGHHH